MKGQIYGQEFYTKRAAFHRKKSAYILSANGQKKGFPDNGQGERRWAFAQIASRYYGTMGTTTFRGAKMPLIAVKIASDPGIHQTFGGQEHKEQSRQIRHQATQAMLSSGLGARFSRGMSGPVGGTYGQGPYYG